jgi:ABC-type transporter Mla subunit MlaD
MNKERRTQIEEILNELGNLKDQVDALASDEQDAFDSMPEGLQNSDRGQSMEASADALDEAGALLSEVLGLLSDAQGG